MKTLYLDCGMGAAGDMLSAALLELLPNPDAALAELNALGIPGVRYTREPAVKCGIMGTRLAVTVNGQAEENGETGKEQGHGHAHEHHHHHSLADIEAIVIALPLPAAVRADVLAVYGEIAAAESAAHGLPVGEVHFHEVGAMDAVADITAACLLMARLAPGRVMASPVRVGYGQVRCAHGILPVPALATATLLKGIPLYGGDLEGEFCTPTGAALLRHFVTAFGAMPVLRVEKIGYGMGTRDFPAANCLRALLGETENAGDTITELSCNLDDMTGEELGFAVERLLQAGALDAYTQAIGMKKSRPGTLLCVLCRPADKEVLLRTLFKHTTTLGVRETEHRRYTLARTAAAVETPGGPVRQKQSGGYGTTRAKYEFEDLARIARENGISLREAARLADDCQNSK